MIQYTVSCDDELDLLNEAWKVLLDVCQGLDGPETVKLRVIGDVTDKAIEVGWPPGETPWIKGVQDICIHKPKSGSYVSHVEMTLTFKIGDYTYKVI